MSMRLGPFALLAALGVGACGLGLTGSLAGGDDAAPDGGVVDGAPDPLDGALVGDSSPDANDLPVLPSFVPPGALVPDAAALIGATAIDTTSLHIDLGDGGAPPPSGVTFASTDVGDASVAVLSVGDFHVSSGLVVTGSRALVVVASGEIDLQAILNGGANGTTPGPGGFAPGLGPGGGAPGGAGSSSRNGGGGGAGHATVGATGGTSSDAPGGTGGPAYTTALVGGSGGGRGDPLDCGNAGGAGGGAIQLFSAKRIVIGASGGVNVRGGGGRKGCGSGSSGAGGGSGGFLLLEAPVLEIHGILAANGGGGGGGGVSNYMGGSDDFDGADGENGRLAASRADGGAGGGYTDQSGGHGASLEGAAESPGDGSRNGGGGGGAAGTIRLRTRGAQPVTTGSVISPAPATDTSL